MPGKHGRVQSGTEVPRKKLMAELKAETDLFTTESLVKGTGLANETKISFL
jgi:hypothetical protein